MPVPYPTPDFLFGRKSDDFWQATNRLFPTLFIGGGADGLSDLVRYNDRTLSRYWIPKNPISLFSDEKTPAQITHETYHYAGIVENYVIYVLEGLQTPSFKLTHDYILTLKNAPD